MRIRAHGHVEQLGVGLDEVRRTTSALQPSDKANAKGVPTVTGSLRRGQAVTEQGGKKAVGLRRREWVVVVSREGGTDSRALASTEKASSRWASAFAALPDLSCGIAFALAQGDFAPVSHREGLKLLRRGVLGGDSPNHPQERRP
eukprot:4595075-Pleurochrysis_carterae.AAC.1